MFFLPFILLLYDDDCERRNEETLPIDLVEILDATPSISFTDRGDSQPSSFLLIFVTKVPTCLYSPRAKFQRPITTGAASYNARQPSNAPISSDPRGLRLSGKAARGKIDVGRNFTTLRTGRRKAFIILRS